MTRLISLLCVGALLCAAPASADDASEAEAAAVKALDDALPGALIHNPMDIQWSPRGKMKTKVVDADGLPSGSAVSAKSKSKTANQWDNALGTDIPGTLSEGDEVQIYFWVRGVKPPKGEEAADVSIVLGRNVEPYDTIAATDVRPGPDWQIRSVKGRAGDDFADGTIKVEYHLGRGAQEIEVGGVYVSKL